MYMQKSYEANYMSRLINISLSSLSGILILYQFTITTMSVSIIIHCHYSSIEFQISLMSGSIHLTLVNSPALDSFDI